MARVKSCKQEAGLTFVIESGATQSLVPSAGLLRDCKAVKNGRTVTLADGSRRSLTMSGTLYCPFLEHEIQAYVVPEMSSCLLSVSALVADGFSICFENNMCSFSRGGHQLFSVECKNRLFVVEMPIANNSPTEVAQVQCANVPTHDGCSHLWHRRVLELCQEGCTEGCKMKAYDKFLDCRVCKQSKVKTCSYPKSSRETTMPFELVHA